MNLLRSLKGIPAFRGMYLAIYSQIKRANKWDFTTAACRRWTNYWFLINFDCNYPLSHHHHHHPEGLVALGWNTGPVGLIIDFSSRRLVDKYNNLWMRGRARWFHKTLFAVQIGFYLQLAGGRVSRGNKNGSKTESTCVIFCDQYRQLLKSLFFLSTCQQRC